MSQLQVLVRKNRKSIDYFEKKLYYMNNSVTMWVGLPCYIG